MDTNMSLSLFKWSKILCPYDFRGWKLLSPVQSVEDFLSPFGGLFFWETLQTNENFESQPTKYLLSCWRMSDLNSIHEAEYLDHLIKINLPRRILIVHPERPPSSILLVHSFFSTSLWEEPGHQSCWTLRLPQLLCGITTTAHVGCNHKLLEQLMRTSAALRV